MDNDHIKQVVERILDRQEDIIVTLGNVKVISANLNSLKENFNEYKKEASLDMDTFLSKVIDLEKEKLGKKDFKMILGIVGAIFTAIWGGVLFFFKSVNILK